MFQLRKPHVTLRKVHSGNIDSREDHPDNFMKGNLQVKSWWYSRNANIIHLFIIFVDMLVCVSSNVFRME